MKRKIIWGLVAVFVILPIGLGIIGSFIPESKSESAFECLEPSAEDLANIESGASEGKFEIVNARYVLQGNELVSSIQQIAPNASQEKVLAGFINDTKEIGIWTIGLSGGPISAINNGARNVSVWGSAATEGSSADQIRELIDASSEVLAVTECVNK